jgi:hypothetical protein
MSVESSSAGQGLDFKAALELLLSPGYSSAVEPTYAGRFFGARPIRRILSPNFKSELPHGTYKDACVAAAEAMPDRKRPASVSLSRSLLGIAMNGREVILSDHVTCIVAPGGERPQEPIEIDVNMRNPEVSPVEPLARIVTALLGQTVEGKLN